jgi:predicted alpha/beta superfamily hydrolase
VETIHSAILNEDRDILIYTPPDYDEARSRYPVLYLLDADDQFHPTTGIVRHLVDNGLIPKLLVVGIRNTDRWRDLTPAGDENLRNELPTSGGGERFLQFLKEELAPYIDTRYRTQPYRILIGHSLGGLMAVYAFLNEPAFFQASMAIDPSLWWNNEALVKQAATFFERHQPVNNYLYLTIDNAFPPSVAMCWALAHNLWRTAPQGFSTAGVHVEIHPMDGVTHGTIPHPSIYEGLQAFFKDWQIPNIQELVNREGIEGVDRFYEGLSKQYGFTIPAPETSVSGAGFILLGLKRQDEAIAVFERLVKTFPESVDALRAAGAGYETVGQLERAKFYYERAVKKAEQGPHMNLPSTREALRRFLRKMEGQKQH